MTATTPSLVGGRVVALSSAVLGLGLLGDTLIYAVLPLYHAEWGISLFMVGVLLSLNRWIRLFANSLTAARRCRSPPASCGASPSPPSI